MILDRAFRVENDNLYDGSGMWTRINFERRFAEGIAAIISAHPLSIRDSAVRNPSGLNERKSSSPNA
jgi:hypothetical protein